MCTDHILKKFSQKIMLAETDLGFEIEVPMYIGKYQSVSVIGTGTSCVVVRVKDTKSHQFFACKVVSREDLVDRGVLLPFEQELRIMESVHHPNIVTTIEVIYDRKYIFVITEECTNGDLLSFICDEFRRKKLNIKKIMQQIGSAIQYLHSRGISHLDIKPDNILLDIHENAKLTDFGSCRYKSSVMQFNAIGTPHYCAPEIFTDTIQDSHKCDIWSLGILLFTIVTGTFPWFSETEEDLMKEITAGIFTIPSDVDLPIADIISKCTSQRPIDRPTIDELLAIPWFEVPRDGLAELQRKSSSPGSPVTIWAKQRPSRIVRPKLGEIHAGSFPVRVTVSNSAVLQHRSPRPSKQMTHSQSGKLSRLVLL